MVRLLGTWEGVGRLGIGGRRPGRGGCDCRMAHSRYLGPTLEVVTIRRSSAYLSSHLRKAGGVASVKAYFLAIRISLCRPRSRLLFIFPIREVDIASAVLRPYCCPCYTR